MRDRWAVVLAAVHVGIAAAFCTLLSSWTYLAGKGLLLGPTEMDMGQDDLPPDSVSQVVAGLGAAFITWTALLLLLLAIAWITADLLYAGDRQRRRLAVRAACGATVWFAIWGVTLLPANAVRHDEVRHPAAAIRAYAQLRQQGFSGSSAVSPGPPERQSLAGRTRLYPLVAVFPVLWAIGLPERAGRPRWRVAVPAIVVCWGLWIAIARLIPWATIEAALG